MPVDPINNVVTLIAGLECAHMRATYLKFQQLEDSTPEDLERDDISWNTYLDIYCKAYRALWKDTSIN